VGDTLSEKARSGLANETDKSQDGFWMGFKPLPRRPGAKKVTLEGIQAIQEQLDYEDMMRAMYPDRDTPENDLG
jgi:hypothetical protein